MKRIIKVILTLILLYGLLELLCFIFGMEASYANRRMIRVLVVCIPFLIVKLYDEKKEKRKEKLKYTLGQTCFGQIQMEPMLKFLAVLLACIAVFFLFFLILFMFPPYGEGVEKTLASDWFLPTILFLLVYTWFALLFIKKTFIDIYYGEDGVSIHRIFGRKDVSWSEFSYLKKKARLVTFYGQDGKKIFTTIDSLKGYSAFEKLYLEKTACRRD